MLSLSFYRALSKDGVAGIFRLWPSWILTKQLAPAAEKVRSYTWWRESGSRLHKVQLSRAVPCRLQTPPLSMCGRTGSWRSCSWLSPKEGNGQPRLCLRRGAQLGISWRALGEVRERNLSDSTRNGWILVLEDWFYRALRLSPVRSCQVMLWLGHRTLPPSRAATNPVIPVRRKPVWRWPRPMDPRMWSCRSHSRMDSRLILREKKALSSTPVRDGSHSSKMVGFLKNYFNSSSEIKA